MSVRTVLIDGKVLYTIRSCISNWSNKKNPDKYNNLVASNTSSSSIPIQQSPSWNVEGYKDLILGEAYRLYDSLLHHFTNSIMDNAIAASYSSSDPKLSSTFPSLSNQSDTHRIKEAESVRNAKGDIAD